jgi:hypothetical protein
LLSRCFALLRQPARNLSRGRRQVQGTTREPAPTKTEEEVKKEAGKNEEEEKTLNAVVAIETNTVNVMPS